MVPNRPGASSTSSRSATDGVPRSGPRGQRNGDAYRTTDGAHSWRVVSRTAIGGDAPGALPYGGDKEIDFRSVTVGWAVFETPIGTAQLFETEDAGRTWVARHVAPAPESRDGGMFGGEPVLNGRYGAVGYTIDRRVGSRTIVYVTTDRGRNWHPVIPPVRLNRGWSTRSLHGAGACSTATRSW